MRRMEKREKPQPREKTKDSDSKGEEKSNAGYIQPPGLKERCQPSRRPASPAIDIMGAQVQ
ncbi:uncharacterized protein N7518_000437 [Penicillium psychrosexuale]|uniref:uncharacterized protein n=1 Tax=Penicillium psychrosexuale TaxID=1002107 RepID=UPI002544E415|nr:uncharacterized protein N7518_000437 [Penicillium psychrosexuale]KAJ5804134.1 hypothetical protein N7518_000437 [Penicillium psychrosexuale]